MAENASPRKDQAAPPRLKVRYRDELLGGLQQELGLTNRMEVPGLEKIVAKERQGLANYEYGRNQVRDALDHLPRTIVFLVLLALGPALALILLVWLVYGREPKTGYDREYEQGPLIEPAAHDPDQARDRCRIADRGPTELADDHARPACPVETRSSALSTDAPAAPRTVLWPIATSFTSNSGSSRTRPASRCSRR